MISRNERVDECTAAVDAFLEKNNVTVETKKQFPVDGGDIGVVYKLGHFGIEITKHQFIIFSQYNSRHIDMLDYDSSTDVLNYALPIAQEFIDDPDITKHVFVRAFHRVKNIFK